MTNIFRDFEYSYSFREQKQKVHSRDLPAVGLAAGQPVAAGWLRGGTGYLGTPQIAQIDTHPCRTKIDTHSR